MPLRPALIGFEHRHNLACNRYEGGKAKQIAKFLLKAFIREVLDGAKGNVSDSV